MCFHPCQLPLLFLFLLVFACGNETPALPSELQNKNEKEAMAVKTAAYMPRYSKAQLTGHFEPQLDTSFVKLGAPYTQKNNMLLRKETAEAFKEMANAAKADGVELLVISSTRNFEYQKGIWERKWKKYEKSHPNAEERAKHILLYSAMPGTSRHHWGTDIDLNDLNNSSFEKGGKYEGVYRWLQENAASYGFCQPYTAKGEMRPSGYNEERWHWSYMPLSEIMLKDYQQLVTIEDINGFLGSETAENVRAIGDYVLGVACL